MVEGGGICALTLTNTFSRTDWPVSLISVAKSTQNNKRNPRRSRRQATNNPRSFPMAKHYEYVGHYFDEGVFLNPGISSPSMQIFNLSSLYDPDTTGTGHQPMGFDQLIPLYDHYTVHRAKVRVTFTSNDATYPQFAVLALSDTSTLPSNLGTVIENGRCQYKILGPRGGSKQVVELTLEVDHSQFFARSVFAGDKYMGTASTSPSDAVFLHVGLQGYAATDTNGAYVFTEIIYESRLSEPKLLAAS